MELYAEIKKLEAQKQEVLKEQQASNLFTNSDQIMNQIEDLQKKLEQANRVESKKIQQQINELQNDKNRAQREIEKFDEQIEKRQSKIERLNEQANKTSIKNQALGKDSERNEYWFFKEEPGKLFVKKTETKTLKKENEDANMVEVEDTQNVSWYFYDEDLVFEKLIEACNLKGIRERRLQENLRKMRDRLKLKKRKGPKQQQNQLVAQNSGPQQQTITGLLSKAESMREEEKKSDELKQEDKAESEEEDDEEEEGKEEDRHILFPNDNFYQSVINSVWYNKKMPSRRQIMMENRVMTTRRGQAQGKPDVVTKKASDDSRPTIAQIKENILNIESAYTDLGAPLNRQWDQKSTRDRIRQQIQDADTISDLQQLLLRLDQGFSHPHMLRYKNTEDEEMQEEQEEQNSENEDESENSEEEEQSKSFPQNEESKGKEEGLDPNVKIVQIQFFKYWPSKDLRSAWRNYVFQEVVEDNILALSIAVRILERVNGEYQQRQIEYQQKKQMREIKQAAQLSKPQAAAAIKKQANFDSSKLSASSRGQVKQKSYKQYFESEESEEDASKNNSDEESSSSEVVDNRRRSSRNPPLQQQQQSSKPTGRPRGRPPGKGNKKKIESEEEQESYDDEESIENSSQQINQDDSNLSQGDEDDDDERSWEDRCYICRKAGSLLCCDGCSHVAHIICIGLKKKPEGEWHCEDCLVKMTQRRTTRGQTIQNSGPRQQVSSNGRQSGRYR